MASVSDKLESLRKRLREAREANQKAVEEEQRHIHEVQSSDASAKVNDQAEVAAKKRRKRRHSELNDAVDIGSADEADGENQDDQIRSMKRRVRAVQLQERGEAVLPVEKTEEDNDGEYGTARDKPENIDRMVAELQNMDKRRAKYRRRRAFDKGRRC